MSANRGGERWVTLRGGPPILIVVRSTSVVAVVIALSVTEAFRPLQVW
jgi:hypothetical protein